MKTLIKLAVIISLGVLMTSCSSGWSCQKRYVNSNMILDSTYIKKHQMTYDSFDKYVLTKYNTKS